MGAYLFARVTGFTVVGLVKKLIFLARGCTGDPSVGWWFTEDTE